MSFRETQSLLDPSSNVTYRHPREGTITRFSWKTLAVTVASAMIPLLLWISIFQTNDDNTQESFPNNLELQFTDTDRDDILKLLNETRVASPYKDPENAKLLSSPLASNNNHPWSLPSKHYHHSNSKFSNSPSISRIGNVTVFIYNFIVTEDIIAPDNFQQKGYLINGQMPGPEIRVRSNSVVILHVTNRISNPLTIHFHGIHQRKTYTSDGVPHLTQTAIPIGGTYTYEFDTWPQVGTFFYHAHTRMDIVWVYGAFIIEDDPDKYSLLSDEYRYDDDRVFVLNGVYHEPLDDLVERIAGPVHNYAADTSSITINGRSYGNWDPDSKNLPLNTLSKNYATGRLLAPAPEEMTETHESPDAETSGYYVCNVTKGLRYRMRFINAASDSLLSCKVENHSMTVIEADGIYVNPVKTDRVVLTPGQRYSVIMIMDQPQGSYLMRCSHMETKGPLNGVAIIQYDGSLPLGKNILQANYPGEEALPMDKWVIDELQPNFWISQVDLYEVPENVHQEFVIEVYEAVLGEQHVYLVNGNLYKDPVVPYFMQLRQHVNISNPPEVYEVIEGQVIQFVFQNQRTGNFCFSHPWHLHGHSFHVVGQGPNRYDPVRDGEQIQQDIKSGKRFQFRDSVTVYANQTMGEFTDGAFCGWVAIRYIARNPGIWLAHCHVTPHMLMGKKLVVWEHPANDPFLKTITNRKEHWRGK